MFYVSSIYVLCLGGGYQVFAKTRLELHKKNSMSQPKKDSREISFPSTISPRQINFPLSRSSLFSEKLLKNSFP